MVKELENLGRASTVKFHKLCNIVKFHKQYRKFHKQCRTVKFHKYSVVPLNFINSVVPLSFINSVVSFINRLCEGSIGSWLVFFFFFFFFNIKIMSFSLRFKFFLSFLLKFKSFSLKFKSFSLNKVIA